MPGFGGDPIAGIMGAIPGAILQAQEKQRELEDRELQRQRLMQAIELAQAAEGRASELHPLNVRRGEVGITADELGIRETEGRLTDQDRLRGSRDETLGAISTGDPVADLFLKTQILSGDLGDAGEALFPYGAGRSREEEFADVEERAYRSARGGRRGAPPIVGSGGGGGGGKDRVTDIRALARARVANLSAPELADAIRIRQDLAAMGELPAEEAIILEELRAEMERQRVAAEGRFKATRERAVNQGLILDAY